MVADKAAMLALKCRLSAVYPDHNLVTIHMRQKTWLEEALPRFSFRATNSTRLLYGLVRQRDKGLRYTGTPHHLRPRTVRNILMKLSPEFDLSLSNQSAPAEEALKSTRNKCGV